MTAHGDSFRAVCATDAGNFLLWDSLTSQTTMLARASDPASERVTATAFGADGTLIAAGLNNAEILVWRPTGEIAAHFRPPAVAPLSASLASASEEDPHTSNDGILRPDHGGYKHYVEKAVTRRAISKRKPAKALCGWTWIPERSAQTGDNMDELPVCPRCQTILDMLPD